MKKQHSNLHICPPTLRRRQYSQLFIPPSISCLQTLSGPSTESLKEHPLARPHFSHCCTNIRSRLSYSGFLPLRIMCLSRCVVDCLVTCVIVCVTICVFVCHTHPHILASLKLPPMHSVTPQTIASNLFGDGSPDSGFQVVISISRSGRQATT